MLIFISISLIVKVLTILVFILQAIDCSYHFIKMVDMLVANNLVIVVCYSLLFEDYISFK